MDKLLSKALDYLSSGQPIKAINQYKKYLKQSPEDFEIWHQLAGLYYETENYNAVKEALEKALAIDPDNIDLLNDLGGFYLLQGQAIQAEQYYRSALNLNPASPILEYNLSQSLFQQNRLIETIEILSQLVKSHPDYIEAHFNLGVVYQKIGQLDAAVKEFKHALSLQPQLIQVHHELGDIYFKKYNLSMSCNHYEQYLKYHPTDQTVIAKLAKNYHLEGKTDTALELLNSHIETGKENDYLYCTLGEILNDCGNMLASEQAFNKAIKINKDNTVALLRLSGVKSFAHTDMKFVESLEKQLQEVSQQDSKIAIHFSLGKIYDDLGDYEKAFHNYKQGNSLKRATLNYDKKLHEEYIRDLINTFIPEHFPSCLKYSSTSDRPVFIVGMARSGTSLIEQILSSHPDIHGAGELLYFSSITDGLSRLMHSDKNYPQCCNELNDDLITKINDEYLELLSRHSENALRVTDKLPSNYARLGLIHLLFPQARIIYCKRKKAENCLSIYFQLFAGRHDYAWDLEDISHNYDQHLRIMNHWKKILPMNIMEVAYEDVITNNEHISRCMLDFLQLKWHDNCLDFYNNKQNVKTLSNWQVRQPVYKRSMNRRENYAPFIMNISL